MDNLKVEFRFIGETVVRETHEGDPIYGDILDVFVNGQQFREVFAVYQIDKWKIDKWGGDYNRERASLLGKALESIGREIHMQAEHGEPAKMWVNGRELVWF